MFNSLLNSFKSCRPAWHNEVWIMKQNTYMKKVVHTLVSAIELQHNANILIVILNTVLEKLQQTVMFTYLLYCTLKTFFHRQCLPILIKIRSFLQKLSQCGPILLVKFEFFWLKLLLRGVIWYNIPLYYHYYEVSKVTFKN